jgi:type IV pilus assembly protein PilM
MSDFQKIGLDIGASSIKLVELLPVGNLRWKLINSITGPAPAGGIIGNQGNLAGISQMIVKLLKDSGIRSRRVVVSLPEDQVSSHIVEMPMMKDDEIKQALQWQVEQYIPIPAEKAAWSYQVIKKDPVLGSVEVLLVAVAKTLVNSYNQVLEQAGLEVGAMETELMAVSRAVVPSDFPLSMVVDIGSKGTDLGVVKNGQLVFSRTVPTAGEAFTRAIEAGLGLDRVQAEEYKNSYGFSKDKLEGKLVSVMSPVLNVISNEIKKTMDFYMSKHPGDGIKVVTLTGGIATLPEIATILSGVTGTEVVVANPYTRVILDPAQAKPLAGSGPFYSVALGLAMREL